MVQCAVPQPAVYATDNMMDARKFFRACEGNVKISQENETIKMECETK